MRGGLRTASIATVLLALTGCEGAPKDDGARAYPAPPIQPTGEIVAQVGPVGITADELSARMNAQSPFIRERFRDQAQRKDFVDQEIRFEVLAQEAWRRKLYEHPDVLKEIKRRMVQVLLKEEIDKRLGPEAVTEDDLKVEYAKSKEEFIKPERIRLSQIVIHVEGDGPRAKARKKLEELEAKILKQEKANDPHAFAEAARATSQDEASKANGGDLDFMSKSELAHRYGDTVAAAVFDNTEIGQMLIADAPNAVLLLRKTGKRRALDRTLEMVKPQLQSRLLRAKRNEALEAFVAELKKSMNVTVNEEALSRVAIKFAADNKPPAEGPK